MDKRRHYVLVLDTETANTIQTDEGLDMSNVLMYDCGWAVVDTRGNVYETASYVNRDIFCGERDLMQSAYYASKIPRYVEDLKAGRRTMASTYEIRQAMLETIQKYGIKEVVAHNARFDQNALNNIQRFTTGSKYRFWFPFNSVVFLDTMKMAEDVICQMPTYRQFCELNGYTLKNGKPRKTAEILWRYISGDWDFEESHTGLEDVLIEAQIMAYCFRQHKKMRKRLFDNPREWPEPTDFQRALSASLRETPCINMGR